jgi:hypothetical protein
VRVDALNESAEVRNGLGLLAELLAVFLERRLDRRQVGRANDVYQRRLNDCRRARSRRHDHRAGGRAGGLRRELVPLLRLGLLGLRAIPLSVDDAAIAGLWLVGNDMLRTREAVADPIEPGGLKIVEVAETVSVQGHVEPTLETIFDVIHKLVSAA